MISIKNKLALGKMEQAGTLLATIFQELPKHINVGVSTLELDAWIAQQLAVKGLVSQMKGYHRYPYVSCISLNDEVVHALPKAEKILKCGDFIKVDVCASWKGYCADMARSFFVESSDANACALQEGALSALNKGIEAMRVGGRLSDVSAAIGNEIERYGYGIVRDFAGHGIGKHMHEDPEIVNYVDSDKGPLLQVGMTFALEPMLTLGSPEVYIAQDGWTVKTVDGSMAAHVEDTVAITENGPKILTRL